MAPCTGCWMDGPSPPSKPRKAEKPFTRPLAGNPRLRPRGYGHGHHWIHALLSRVPFLERNSYRYPAINILDLRVSRAFRVRERANLQLIGEAFNILNHVNYTAVTTQMFSTGGTAANPILTYTPAFGLLTAANNNNVYTARQIQIGARISF